MRHLPISLDLEGRRVVVAGGGEMALAKLRLLAKTGAKITVLGETPSTAIVAAAGAAGAEVAEKPAEGVDLLGAVAVYVANADPEDDARIAALARSAGALVNVVDNLEASDFLTPAIVDRSPVTVAIGSEGAAPVLAREIKAEIEETLPPTLGLLAQVAARARAAASKLPAGKSRRRMWRRFFRDAGPRALATGGVSGAEKALARVLDDAGQAAQPTGRVHLIGAGPGDPELMTMKARRLLHDADVVIYDRLAGGQALDLARREAEFIEVGKTPGGKSWRQDDINALMIEKARAGLEVARLKSGDPGVFGRLDEETMALRDADVAFAIVPGVTAAAAAAAAAGVSLTRRGRNSAIRILTGHDVDGFAEHDWRGLAKPGAAAAIYMGVAAAGYLQGRLLMHGAAPTTPMCVVENASLPTQKLVPATLGGLTARMADAEVKGPAILFLGLAPDEALAAQPTLDAAAGA